MPIIFNILFDLLEEENGIRDSKVNRIWAIMNFKYISKLFLKKIILCKSRVKVDRWFGILHPSLIAENMYIRIYFIKNIYILYKTKEARDKMQLEDIKKREKKKLNW